MVSTGQFHAAYVHNRKKFLSETHLTFFSWTLWLLISLTEIPRAESLFFLPDQAQASLADLGDCIDRELAKSHHDSEIETQATRKAHYIQWCTVHHIPDPCGSDVRYERIVAMYIKDVIKGTNYINNEVLQSMMVHSYADAVNTLF